MPGRLIIDSNLLLLLVIGAVEDGRHIKNSKRLNAFTSLDYDNVLKIMYEYDEIYITPYIATEVSNLIDLNGSARLLAFEFARELFCSQCKKIDVEIDNDCDSELFLRYGITDSSLIKLAPDYFILTCDYRLLEELFKINMNNIIPYNLSK